MVTIRGGSFTNEDLRQAKELADTVAQNTAANLGQDSRARRQEFLLNRYTPDYKPQVQVAARGLLGGYDPDFGEEMGTEVFSPQGVAYIPQGIANIPNVANISSGYPMKPDPGYEAALQKATPSGLEGIIQGFLGSLTGSNPAIYMQTDEYGDPMGGGNYAVGRTFENAETAKRLGFIPVGRDAGGNIVYDVDPAIKASQDRQDRDARLDDERRERAAMLAAQQQQPIDPCPKGYRMDPVSRVCVPVDDTTEPVETTKRTYETMTEPVADYTAKTEFTVPTVTLPDILTYE